MKGMIRPSGKKCQSLTGACKRQAKKKEANEFRLMAGIIENSVKYLEGLNLQVCATVVRTRVTIFIEKKHEMQTEVKSS